MVVPLELLQNYFSLTFSLGSFGNISVGPDDENNLGFLHCNLRHLKFVSSIKFGISLKASLFFAGKSRYSNYIFRLTSFDFTFTLST